MRNTDGMHGHTVANGVFEVHQHRGEALGLFLDLNAVWP